MWQAENASRLELKSIIDIALRGSAEHENRQNDFYCKIKMLYEFL